MRRTQIYLTDEQRVWLKRQAAESGRPQSELIREALDQYLGRHSREHKKDVLKNAAGIWADRDDVAALGSSRGTMDRDLSE